MSPNAARYIPKCREKSVKGKPNFNFVRVSKNASFDQSFYVSRPISSESSKTYLLIKVFYVSRPISSVIKNASFDQSFLCSSSKFFLKTLCWRCSDYLLVSSATLSRKIRNTSTLSMLVYFETNSLCLILKVCNALVCSGKLRRDWRSFIIKKCPAENDYYSLNIPQTNFRLLTSYFESSGSWSN